jgi:hypothetical protein
MDLKKTPFSDFEKSKKYCVTSFNELGVNVTVLNYAEIKTKIPSGNFYKFGAYEGGKLYWYFNGQAVANSRQKMLEIFSAILIVTKNTEQKPFVFKVRSK